MPPTPITIRLDDERRLRLETAARRQGLTLSESIRAAIDAYLGIEVEDDWPSPGDAPRSLNLVERQTLSLLEDILARTSGDPYERKAHEKQRDLLAEGHTGLYEEVFQGIYPEMPYEDCRLVWDILDMFRVLLGSWQKLGTGEPLPDDLKFRGFDGNHPRESRMLLFADRLLKDDKYEEQHERFYKELDGGNSHSPTLALYDRMLRVFKPIWQRRMRGVGFHLSRDEIDQVRAAVPYPRD